jgi:hypothetical protein
MARLLLPAQYALTTPVAFGAGSWPGTAQMPEASIWSIGIAADASAAQTNEKAAASHTQAAAAAVIDVQRRIW